MAGVYHRRRRPTGALCYTHASVGPRRRGRLESHDGQGEGTTHEPRGAARHRGAARLGGELRMAAFQPRTSVLDLDMEVDPNLDHLISHDPDGFFTAIEGDETVGFGAAHVRSRQCILSELWVLPQHQGKGAGEVLLKRALAYGERSGAREFLGAGSARAGDPGPAAATRFHSADPGLPVPAAPAAIARPWPGAVGSLLPGQERHHRPARPPRPGRHRPDRPRHPRASPARWTTPTGSRSEAFSAALVRQGVAHRRATATAEAEQVGPVAGSSRDAALCALGWALRLARRAPCPGPAGGPVPARFEAAVEALLEAGARIQATLLLYGAALSAASTAACSAPPTCHDRSPPSKLRAGSALPGRLRERAQPRAAPGRHASRRADAGSSPAPAPARPGPSSTASAASSRTASRRARILLLTFTNKAAREMLDRVEQLVEGVGRTGDRRHLPLGRPPHPAPLRRTARLQRPLLDPRPGGRRRPDGPGPRRPQPRAAASAGLPRPRLLVDLYSFVINTGRDLEAGADRPGAPVPRPGRGRSRRCSAATSSASGRPTRWTSTTCCSTGCCC